MKKYFEAPRGKQRIHDHEWSMTQKKIREAISRVVELLTCQTCASFEADLKAGKFKLETPLVYKLLMEVDKNGKSLLWLFDKMIPTEKTTEREEVEPVLKMIINKEEENL